MLADGWDCAVYNAPNTEACGGCLVLGDKAWAARTGIVAAVALPVMTSRVRS